MEWSRRFGVLLSPSHRASQERPDLNAAAIDTVGEAVADYLPERQHRAVQPS